MKKLLIFILIVAAAAGAYFYFSDDSEYVPDVAIEAGANEQGHTAPTQQTAKTNLALLQALPFADRGDFDLAQQGLIAAPEALVIKNIKGEIIWDLTQYAFTQNDAPATANPSLWRQTQLNTMAGLFQVAEGIYQIRGFDLANMTLIQGGSGWIVVDPLTAQETAAAALAFAHEHLGEQPVSAILFTHSHIDHFGGVDGVLPTDRKIPIIAPKGFMDEATSENVMAGVAMQRRAGYMYGRDLARNERGHIGTGLGQEPPFKGTIGIAQPTQIVEHTGQTLNIDGVDFEFQYTPASEAPAEFTFYLPKQQAFCGAEVISRNLHNVYTLRGAKVRDALLWSDYIHEALNLFGNRTAVYFGSHHWPLWGQDNIQTFMKRQRDTYKYIHDQSLRLANLGYTPKEIAEQVKLPESLQGTFYNRDYYGTVSHNSKAVYQWYFGWYDANPANLNPLPPSDAGAKYLEFMGGADAVVDKAQTSFDAGDYRWVAEVLNHVVMAEPNHAPARALLAKTYDQLGYVAESGPWRDVYLSAAYELRHGRSEQKVNMNNAINLLSAIPLDKFFDAMAARLNGPDADGEDLAVNFIFTDLDQGYHLWIENAVLHHEPYTDQTANATLRLTHSLFIEMAVNDAGASALMSDDLDIEGSSIDLISFFGLLDKPDGRFGIVTP